MLSSVSKPVNSPSVMNVRVAVKLAEGNGSGSSQNLAHRTRELGSTALRKSAGTSDASAQSPDFPVPCHSSNVMQSGVQKTACVLFCLCSSAG